MLIPISAPKPYSKPSANLVDVLTITELELGLTYGATGIKVWIFKGEVMEHDPMAQDKKMGNAKGPSSKTMDQG